MAEANRYPGSRSFEDTELDRILFFGREKEQFTLLHTILAEDLVLLYAKSGVGKTSLLNAGILDKLRQADYFPVRLRILGGSIEEVGRQIREQAEKSNIEIQEREFGACLLWNFFREVEFWRGNTLLTPVLIFDQFEELFTACSNDQRREFIKSFSYLTGKRLPLRLRKATTVANLPSEKVPTFKIVISVREDFLGEIEALAAEVPQVMHNRFRLVRLTRNQAEQAIRKPAEAEDGRLSSMAFTYADETIEWMLDFLCRQRDRNGFVQSDEVEPFQLQLLCEHLEERIRDLREQKRREYPWSFSLEKITILPEDLGGELGMQQVLVDFYRKQVSQLDTEANQKALRRLCENGLISAQERRLSLEEGQIELQFGVRKAVLQKLVMQRLMRVEPRVGSNYYELSHDTLVHAILNAKQTYELLEEIRVKNDPGVPYKLAEEHALKG